MVDIAEKKRDRIARRKDWLKNRTALKTGNSFLRQVAVSCSVLLWCHRRCWRGGTCMRGKRSLFP